MSARRTAALAGLTRYRTGQPCKYGHGGERFTSSGACVECIRGYSASFRSRGRGFENVLVLAHPDDVPLIRQFAASLLAARPVDGIAPVTP